MKIIKIIKIIFFSILVFTICFLLLKTDTTQGATSEIDNRALASFDYNLDKTFLCTVDAYFKDRIGFRNELINYYIKFNDVLFHEMLHPIYEYGKEDYVFFKMKKETVDKNFIESFCVYLKKVQDYCEQRNVPFIYCLNPSKTTVYDECLPYGYIYRSLFKTEFLKKLKEHQINHIDNVHLLYEKSKNEQVFNRKFDAGHWNDLGAFYGTNHLLEKVSEYFHEVEPFNFNDFEMDSIVQESLPVSKFLIHEKVPQFSLKEQTYKNTTNDYSGIKLDNSHRFFVSYDSYKEKLPDVLFFQGSYYISRNKFYANRFHQVVGVHNYQNFLNFDYFFNIVKPDCVILETTEYATTSEYFNMEKMKSKNLNSMYENVKNKPHKILNIYDIQNFKTIFYENSHLVEIVFDLNDQIAFGYFFSNGKEYDLSIKNKQASVTLLKNDYDENTVKIMLFEDFK